MKRGPRIEVPSARDDELPLRTLVATSLACLTLGLLVAYGATDRETVHAVASEPHGAAPSASAEEPPAPPPSVRAPVAEPQAEPDPSLARAVVPEAAPVVSAPDAAIADPAPVAAAEPPVAPDVLPAPSTEPPIEIVGPPLEGAGPAVPAAAGSTAPAPRPLRVEPGVFAYLRCEGLRQRRGKFPCPRDRGLETRLREIIEALPTCREAHAISRGIFDIRLELGEGGAVQELHVKAPNEAADRAVRACAGPALRKEHTELRPTRMIVSMRFRAR